MNNFTVYLCPICAVPVITAMSAAARQLVVNAEPAVGGKTVLEWRGGVHPLARQVSPNRASASLLRVLHTCDIAGKGRRL